MMMNLSDKIYNSISNLPWVNNYHNNIDYNEEIDYNMRVAVKQIEDLVEGIELTQELSKGDLKQTLPPYKQATIKDEEQEEPGKPLASDYVPEDE